MWTPQPTTTVIVLLDRCRMVAVSLDQPLFVAVVRPNDDLRHWSLLLGSIYMWQGQPGQIPLPSSRNIENAPNMSASCLPTGFVGEVFVATSLYGSFLVLFTLSSLVLHSQILTNKRQSSGSLGTSIHLALGYMLFFIVSLVCWRFVLRQAITPTDFEYLTELDYPLYNIHTPKTLLQGQARE